MRTTVPNLYAAGCVTPANCQMIVAAGQGAAAAQAINRDLFEESLASHSLRRFREVQLEEEKTEPVEPAAVKVEEAAPVEPAEPEAAPEPVDEAGD